MLKVDSKETIFNYDGTIATPSLTLFAQNERRLAKKKQDIEDMENEYDLLKKQTFSCYKSNINYLHFDKSLILCARQWESMLSKGVDKEGNKIDKRKSYKEKTSYEYIFGLLCDTIGIESKLVKLNSIIDYNFGEAYDFEFEYGNHKWRLEVPMIDGIKMKSYEYYGVEVFKLKIYHCNGCWSESIGSTFCEDEVKTIMKKGLEKYLTE